MIQQILKLIEQAGVLMWQQRNHKRLLGNTFDTVASHSHHAAIIAYCICRQEGLSHEDGLKAMAMMVFHDLAEARTTDLDLVAKQYGSVNEEKAIDDQYKNLNFGDDLKKLTYEYKEKKSLIAKCAKDADSLDQIYQE